MPQPEYGIPQSIKFHDLELWLNCSQYLLDLLLPFFTQWNLRRLAVVERVAITTIDVGLVENSLQGQTNICIGRISPQ
jgi:hypothetical protein